MAMESRLSGGIDESAERKSIYALVASKVIADLESAMRDPPNLGVVVKLLISQMANELADFERAKPDRQIGAGFKAEEFIRQTGARFVYGGDWPHYCAEEDAIYFPISESFAPEECRLTIKARELVHWTGHRSRLNRNYGTLKYGTEGHAREVLTAEFGAAFLCTLLEITLDVSKLHAANVARWLRAIKTDRRAALSLAAKDAEDAVDYLFLLQDDIVLTSAGGKA